MNKTPIEMIEILPVEELERAKKFVTLGEKLNCKSIVRFASAHKSWKCVFSMKKPSRVLFTLECTAERWHVKACLWNIDAYADYLVSCSEKIKSIIKNAYDCKRCNDRCKGGAEFTIENITYKKCIGCCFYFSKMENKDWCDLLTLVEKESEIN